MGAYWIKWLERGNSSVNHTFPHVDVFLQGWLSHVLLLAPFYAGMRATEQAFSIVFWNVSKCDLFQQAWVKAARDIALFSGVLSF